MKNDQNEHFGLTFVETKCDSHRAIASFSKAVTFKCYITSALIWLPEHFEIVMFEQF